MAGWLIERYPRFEADKGGGSGGGGEGGGGTGEANPGGNAGEGGAGKEVGKGAESEGFKAISTQEEFDAALKTRLNRQEQALRKSLSDEITTKLKTEAETAKALEDGNYKALLEAETVKREAAERERDAEKQSALKTRIAAKHKLPDALASRLTGTTEEELEADAKELAKLVTAKAPVDNDVGAGKGGAGKGPSDRPIQKERNEGDAKPTYTFDGQPKVAWPKSP